MRIFTRGKTGLTNNQLKIKPFSKWRRACFQAAERVGILSAAYKSPNAAYAVLTAGLNYSGGALFKVQVICSRVAQLELSKLIFSQFIYHCIFFSTLVK